MGALCGIVLTRSGGMKAPCELCSAARALRRCPAHARPDGLAAATSEGLRPLPLDRLTRRFTSRRSLTSSSRSTLVRASGGPSPRSISAKHTHSRSEVSVRSRSRATREMVRPPFSTSCRLVSRAEAYLPMPTRISKAKVSADALAAVADPTMANRLVQAVDPQRLARVRADLPRRASCRGRPPAGAVPAIGVAPSGTDPATPTADGRCFDIPGRGRKGQADSPSDSAHPARWRRFSDTSAGHL